ncbi:MAG: hypothetical protein D6679_10630 [Candidatus Hydrogenedentota bacterium]|nr:MAG: hypothetical protein D6679_10630 [Candidatus Hydrogenedentota bacterium]
MVSKRSRNFCLFFSPLFLPLALSHFPFSGTTDVPWFPPFRVFGGFFVYCFSFAILRFSFYDLERGL